MDNVILKKNGDDVMKNEIVLFENQNVKLEVNIKDDTVWLNREQIAKLFNRDIKTIGKHINNALQEELDYSTVAKFATVQKEGNRDVKREIEYYNLDMIISVGFRVKSQNGIIFRKWANKVLKEYLLKGYAINQKRLEYLEKTVKLINIAGRIDDEISASDAKEIIKVIGNYSNALNLLDDYDHRCVVKPKGTKNANMLTYQECIDIISKLRFNNDSNLFALERNEGLKAILGAIYQSFDGKDVYPSIQEKAANFFYMIIHFFLLVIIIYLLLFIIKLDSVSNFGMFCRSACYLLFFLVLFSWVIL